MNVQWTWGLMGTKTGKFAVNNFGKRSNTDAEWGRQLISPCFHGVLPGTNRRWVAGCNNQCMVWNQLVGGFNPSEKYESQLGWLFTIYGKITNVPNHQPDVEPITLWDVLYYFSPEDGGVPDPAAGMPPAGPRTHEVAMPCFRYGPYGFSFPTNLHINLLAASDQIHHTFQCWVIWWCWCTSTRLYLVTANDTKSLNHKPSPTTVQSQQSHFWCWKKRTTRPECIIYSSYVEND